MSVISTLNRKDQISALLKSIETGDIAAVSVVNEAKYIQHNPLTTEGSEGLAALFSRLAKTSPSVTIVRAFEDGDFIFLHTEYDFSSLKICFEVFRFEDGFAVEHWDNLEPNLPPSPSGHTMVNGPTEATDLGNTERNRGIVQDFVEEVLVNRKIERLESFICSNNFIQHNSRIADGLPALQAALEATHNGQLKLQYSKLHRVLAEGNFVLSVSEGYFSGVHSSFYDLFRIDEGILVEHWDTIEAIPERAEWKNNNGKF